MMPECLGSLLIMSGESMTAGDLGLKNRKLLIQTTLSSGCLFTGSGNGLSAAETNLIRSSVVRKKCLYCFTPQSWVFTLLSLYANKITLDGGRRYAA